ncbi:MAG: hemolysin family protein [Rubricoccaceae bacterium]
MTFVIPILLLLVVSAFFSGSEIAFVTANRLKTEVRARQGGWPGRIVQEFLADPTTFLTTTLVGNNVALVLYSMLMSLALEAPLTGFYESTFGLASPTGLVLVTQTIVAALIVLLVGEVIPKSLLRQPSGRVLLALAVPLKLTYWLFIVLIKLAGWTSGLIVKLVGTPSDTFKQFIRRDFELVIRESRETGSLDLDEEESEILSNVFELRSLRVKDSMVPRTEIQAVEEGCELDEVRRTFIETGFSRLPVYQESIDNIVGVVLAHDLFHGPDSLSGILRPARVVPESKPARDLLFDFLRGSDGRKGASSLVIVVDEYGGTAGIVTLEDLLEELFGDIRDEHDAAAAPIRQLDDRTWLVHGRVELDDLASQTDIALPEGEYDTVAGYLLDQIGHVPAERAVVDLNGYRFTILKASAARIEAIRMMRL